MSKFQRTCPTDSNPKGKRRFATLEFADRELDKIWKFAVKGTNRATTLPCRSYKCDRCRGYHHTSQPLRREQLEQHDISA